MKNNYQLSETEKVVVAFSNIFKDVHVDSLNNEVTKLRKREEFILKNKEKAVNSKK